MSPEGRSSREDTMFLVFLGFPPVRSFLPRTESPRFIPLVMP